MIFSSLSLAGEESSVAELIDDVQQHHFYNIIF